MTLQKQKEDDDLLIETFIDVTKDRQTFEFSTSFRYYKITSKYSNLIRISTSLT